MPSLANRRKAAARSILSWRSLESFGSVVNDCLRFAKHMLRTAAGCDDRLSRLRLRRTNVDRRCEDATQRRVPKTGRLSPHLDDAIRTLLGGCAGLVIELTEPAG